MRHRPIIMVALLTAQGGFFQEAAADSMDSAKPASSLPTLARSAKPLEFATPDKAFSIELTGSVQVDVASVFGRDGQRIGRSAAAELRRARIGVEGRLFKDFEYTFRWNFAGFPDDAGRLSRLSLAYRGLKSFRFIGGAFKPRITLDNSQSSNDILFLERGTITNLVSSLAGGGARIGAGAEYRASRLFAAAYLTGGDFNDRGDERQRGAIVRLAGTPINVNGATLHLGVSASWVFTPTLPGGERAVDIGDEPELRPEVRELIGTGPLAARSIRTEGGEVGFSWNRFWAQGEYHRILVDRPQGFAQTQFDGWYAQASYLLTGLPREWRESRGAWGRPKPGGAFDPAAGEWGALEAGLRYSKVDLNDGDIRAGQQAVWTSGLSWYPTEDLRVTVQYQTGQITPAGEDRALRFQAVGVRLQTTF